MDNLNYFKDLFESIPDYRKVVLLIFIGKDHKNLSKEIGFIKNGINQLSLKYKIILLEEYEKYLEKIRNEEESGIEKYLIKLLEAYFSKLFEDIRYERSLILLLSLVEPDKLKQSKLTGQEINFIKDLPLDKIHRQRILKEIIAMNLLEKHFSN